MMLVHFFIALLLSLCTALPSADLLHRDVPPIPQTIFQFNSSIIPENLLLRSSNGQLLVVANTVPQVFQLDPNANSSQLLRLVYTFPRAQSLFGIVELSTDVFVVTTGNFTVTNGSTPGTWSVWTLDLTGFQIPSYDPSRVVAKQVITTRSFVFNYDGLAIVNDTAGLLAATDFRAGAIWTLDIKQNNVTLLASGSQLQGVPGTLFDQSGANGLKIRGSQLYYTNTGRGTLGSIQVNTATGEAAGPLTTIYNYGFHLDDFNIANGGNVYLTTIDTNPVGGIYRRLAGTPNGQNGTSQVLSAFGTNAVVFQNDIAHQANCVLIYLRGLASEVAKATLPGHC